MSLSRLVIHNLRNLQSVDIELSAELNLFYGANGAGKTSVLEGVSMLGVARSFRSHRPSTLLRSGSEAMSVFGRLNSGRTLGVEHKGGFAKLKVAGEVTTSAADLAHELPLVAIHAHSVDLVSGPPKGRRQWLDWLVFHVKPTFLQLWRRLQNCLKHRNTLLRNGRIADAEIGPWDQQLQGLAEEIDLQRREVFKQLEARVQALISNLPALSNVDLRYQRGWSKETSFAESLAQHRLQDQQRGFTQQGPHRADIRLSVDGVPVADKLSRGQQKLLAIALLLAQGAECSASIGRECLYLLDDLPSELDDVSRAIVAGWLDKSPAQVFVTGIERKDLLGIWPSKSNKTFHVEHGVISHCE